MTFNMEVSGAEKSALCQRPDRVLDPTSYVELNPGISEPDLRAQADRAAALKAPICRQWAGGVAIQLGRMEWGPDGKQHLVGLTEDQAFTCLSNGIYPFTRQVTWPGTTTPNSEAHQWSIIRDQWSKTGYNPILYPDCECAPLNEVDDPAVKALRDRCIHDNLLRKRIFGPGLDPNALIATLNNLQDPDYKHRRLQWDTYVMQCVSDSFAALYGTSPQWFLPNYIGPTYYPIDDDNGVQLPNLRLAPNQLSNVGNYNEGEAINALCVKHANAFEHPERTVLHLDAMTYDGDNYERCRYWKGPIVVWQDSPSDIMLQRFPALDRIARRVNQERAA